MVSSYGKQRFRNGENMLRKVFGEKLENEIYHDREAAYVVLIVDGKIAVVKTSSGKLFLPGGKIEAGESLEECITRECLEDFYALNTYIYSNFYADNLAANVQNFYTSYKTWYSKNLINTFPKYGILGFDTGMYFISAIHKYGANFENNLDKIKYASIQTGFDFHRVNNWGGFINTNLFIVHYNNDYTVTRTELR